MFKIRPATEQDIPAIIQIAEQTWWPTYADILSTAQLRYMLDQLYAPEILHSHITNGTQTFLILVSENTPQGFAAFSSKPDEPGVWKIHKLYVLPQNHKRGWGRELVEAIKTTAVSKGIRTLDLNVNRFNTARQFYERLGFRVIKEEDVPIGPYFMNDYVMRLEF